MTTFALRLYVQHNLGDPRIAARVWSHLGAPLVRATQYDAVENAKKKFTPTAARAAAKLFAAKGKLFVLGDRESFQATFGKLAPGLFAWRVFLDTSAVDGARGGSWIDWFHALCDELPVLFGFGCTNEEFNAKHEVVQKVGAGQTRSWLGASTAELHRFLPGVYWLTLFGRELTQSFGEARLHRIKEAIPTRLAGGQLSLRLAEPAGPRDLDQRLALERTIADRIGRNRFFDRTRDPARLEPVPAFVERLRQLREQA